MQFKYLGLYLSALFDGFVGFTFIVDPSSLLGGYKPAQGMESWNTENFGIACIFWAMLVLCKAGDRTIQAFNALWGFVWAACLAQQVFGVAWRPEIVLVGQEQG